MFPHRRAMFNRSPQWVLGSTAIIMIICGNTFFVGEVYLSLFVYLEKRLRSDFGKTYENTVFSSSIMLREIRILCGPNSGGGSQSTIEMVQHRCWEQIRDFDRAFRLANLSFLIQDYTVQHSPHYKSGPEWRGSRLTKLVRDGQPNKE